MPDVAAQKGISTLSISLYNNDQDAGPDCECQACFAGCMLALSQSIFLESRLSLQVAAITANICISRRWMCISKKAHWCGLVQLLPTCYYVVAGQSRFVGAEHYVGEILVPGSRHLADI